MLEEELLITPEDIERISKVVADVITNQSSEIIINQTYGFITEELIVESIDLDTLASATAGILDPLGQLRDWFVGLFNSVSTWIVQSIKVFLADLIAEVLIRLGEVAPEIATKLAEAINIIGGAIANAIDLISTAVIRAVDGLATAIANAIDRVATSIGNAIETVGGAIINVIEGIGNTLSNSIMKVAASISIGIDLIGETIEAKTTEIITSTSIAISQGIDMIGESIERAFVRVSIGIDTLGQSLKNLSDTVSQGIDMIGESIKGAFVNVSAGIDTLSQSLKNLSDTVSQGIDEVGESIERSFVRVSIGIDTLGQSLSELIRNVSDSLSYGIASVSSTLDESFDTFLANLTSLREYVFESFKQTLELVDSGFTQIGVALTSFINGVLDAGIRVSSAIETHPRLLSALLWELMPEGFRKLADFLPSAVERLTQGVEPGWVISASPQLVVGLKLVLPKNELPAFWSTPSALFAPLIHGLLGMYEAHIQPALSPISNMLWKGLQTIWEGLVAFGGIIWKGIEGLWDAIKGGVEGVSKLLFNFSMVLSKFAYDAMTGAIQVIGSPIAIAVKGFVKWLLETAYSVASDIGDIITTLASRLLAPTGSVMGEAVEKPFQDLVSRLAKGERIMGEWVELGQFAAIYWVSLITSQALSYGCWAALHGLGMVFNKVEIRTPIRIKVKGKGKVSPAGVGAEGGADAETGTETNITINLGLMFRQLASEIRRHGDTFARSLVYGLGIWMTQPMMRLASSAFRDVLVLELPDIGIMTEITRRHMPTEKFDEILEKYRSFLRLYGYRSEIIEWITNPEAFIEVIDRFGTVRKIPISLIYDLPSASDVARMVIRDIFGVGRTAIESFLKVYKARGMHEDVGALYFMLHYRYPPPERLWTFTVRGLSNMLWATQPQIVFEAVKQELEYLKAPIPTDARYWNADTPQKARALLSAFNYYMSWHDYFMGTWLRREVIDAPDNFTSDNQIVIDTLADIPTKIDQRWMVKWGLYELLSSRGVTAASPVEEFVTKVVDGQAKSNIIIDLTNFSRTLQATGLHPHWVPLTAVAETMNVLSEERTLLRTGVIGLFKEGFYDLNTVSSILSGAVVASFKIAYFDLNTYRWVEGWINQPIMFLPAEQKLLELRALMDRSLDILKEIQRDISTAYQDHIIDSPEDFERTLTDVIKHVNEFYAKDYEKITGRPLPNGLQLKYVKEYYTPYIEALETMREVYVVRRIRAWTQRWVGWIMYRLATGVANRQDIINLLDTVSGYAKLTDYEREFLEKIMESMYAIAIREYIPTPSQLATLSEYIHIPSDFIDKVFEARFVPPAWRNIWKQYISIRPIADDIKSLLSSYRRALIYTTIPTDIEKEILNYAKMIGFTDEEMRILGLRVALEELIQQSREYIPTPYTLALIAEYVPLTSDLIIKVFEARRVPNEWREVWFKFISYYPIKSEARSLLSTYTSALRYGIISKDDFKKFMDSLLNLGFTQTEIELITKRIEMEEHIAFMRASLTEYIPTPSMLASISEIVPEARQFFDEVMEARRVPEAWRAIWAKYIDYKPIIDDVKKMLTRVENLYEYFAITEDAYLRVLKSVQYLGWTDKEIDFMLQVSRYARWLRAYRELVGDVDRMVTISNYSPKAEEYALGNLYKMIDAMPVDPATKQTLKTMWEQFIRNRHIKDEVITYVRDLVNLYIEGLLSKQDLEKELRWLEDWGLSKYEREFWLKIADARLARKLKIPVVFAT